MGKVGVRSRIEKWGKEQGLGPKRVLKALVKKFKTPTGIVAALRLGPTAAPTVRALLREAGLYKPFRFVEAVTKLGFESVRAFFVANTMKTYQGMADQVGCSWMAVQNQYAREFKVELEGVARGK